VSGVLVTVGRIVLLALALAGCAGSASETRAPSVGGLTDLTEIEQLHERFNDEQGVPRLIVLLSPT
jgi:hypothetical protein